MTTFRILGPIEAWDGERRLAVGGPRQLRLLAFLVLHANRAVPNERLVDALWGQRRTESDNRLRMAVARLRKGLGSDQPDTPAQLRTVAGGYILDLAPEQVDAEQFARQADAGREALGAGEADRAARLIRGALALWRGPPLAEVAFEDFAQGEIRRLDELRMAAVEARIDADLRLGRHCELVSELEGLLIEHPIRERLAVQLMLALYRSDRQADALEVFQRTRVELADQLGLEPGPTLRALQAEILRQASTLDAARGPRAADEALDGGRRIATALSARFAVPLPGRLIPHGPAVLVGRSAERHALIALLELVATSGRGAAFVTGEPGIGKTRLVSEVAHDAHERGALVLGGRCDDGLGIPYQPFVEALEHLVEHAPRPLLDAHLDEFGGSLARLVPELAPELSAPLDTMPPASESERYVLFRAIEGLLASASTTGGLLLVLEDLHWADVETLQLLRRLLTSPRRPPLTVLCTSRTAELDEGHPVRELSGTSIASPTGFAWS